MQGAYLESVFSLGLCEKSLSRNTEVAVVKAMLGGEENEAAKIKVWTDETVGFAAC